MHIVIFTHPEFTYSLSISKYAEMLAIGMQEKHHTVEIWTAREFFHRLPLSALYKKWFGYIDRFLIFPIIARRRIKKRPEDTLFVFADQALGPWISLIGSRPHLIHCHDLLALRSASKEFPGNPTGMTGRVYQKLILRGFRKGRNFISISQKTRSDLHRSLNSLPQVSEVVYNGLNQDFKPGDPLVARKAVGKETDIPAEKGYILHVGGNQFYKNRIGVLKIYDQWRKKSKTDLSLVMVGSQPTTEMKLFLNSSQVSEDIYFISSVPDELLKLIYQGAHVFLFPSIEEGFGWPIAEAMASGCPVITTNKAPMTEVGGNSCYYIPPFDHNGRNETTWAAECADILEEVVNLSREDREKLIASGIQNSRRFNTHISLGEIERIYQKVLESYSFSA